MVRVSCFRLFHSYVDDSLELLSSTGALSLLDLVVVYGQVYSTYVIVLGLRLQSIHLVVISSLRVHCLVLFAWRDPMWWCLCFPCEESSSAVWHLESVLLNVLIRIELHCDVNARQTLRSRSAVSFFSG